MGAISQYPVYPPNGLAPSSGAAVPYSAGGSTYRGSPSQLLGVVSAMDFGAKGDGVTDDTAALQAALAAAEASGCKKLYLQAGVYVVSAASGSILNSGTAGVEIFGDGVGKTTILYKANQTLISNVKIVNFSGQFQSIHDLTITAGSGLNGALSALQSIVAGGSGYTNGDSLTLVGGTRTIAAVVTVTVSGGVVTGLSAVSNGGSYTVQGVVSNIGGTYTATGGTGSGAQIQMQGPNLTGVAFDQGSFGGQAYNLEISNMWGLNNAGGVGISLYQPPTVNLFSTTLGTTFGAGGAQTVTPGSMAGIYPGRTLRITGTNPETIQVTSTTATTFTATFASAHNAADTVNGYSLGEQQYRICNVHVHDCFQATGMILNAGQGVVEDCRIYNVGCNGNQHGFYIQQGQGTKLLNVYVEGASGFSYHLHLGASSFGDASGLSLTDCWSVNAGTQHLIADTVTSDGTDPDTPSGQQLNRYVTLKGCVFRCTINSKTPVTGVGVGVQAAGATIIGCIFEDTCRGGVWLATTGGASTMKQTVTGCIFNQLNNPNNASVPCQVGVNSIVSGCQFIGFTHNGSVVTANGNSQVLGCYFDYTGSGGRAVTVNGDEVVVANNRGTIGGSSGSTFIGYFGSYKATIAGNRVTLANGAHFFYDGGLSPTGEIAHNAWSGSTGGFRYTAAASTALDVHDNSGVYNFGNTTSNTQALTSVSGRLLSVAAGANTLTGGLAVTQAGTANSGTSDTQFLGFAPCDKSSTSGNFYICGTKPGDIVKVTTDGAWTAGDVGILSTTSGGKIHDTGAATIPAAGTSYGIFQDTGGAGGTATFLVMRTLQ